MSPIWTRVLGFACGALAPALAAAATATMTAPDGRALGTVTLTQGPAGVLIDVQLSGIPAGAHGFHIHENGTCAPDFGAAGGHFNPGGQEHGISNPAGSHAGDMPNVYAAADGTVAAQLLNSKVTLSAGSNSLFDKNGSSIVVHEKPDTHGPDAGAGGRIACGVIVE